MFPTNICLETYQKKKKGNRVCFRDMMDQIYACTDTNHARHVIGSRYILR